MKIRKRLPLSVYYRISVCMQMLVERLILHTIHFHLRHRVSILCPRARKPLPRSPQLYSEGCLSRDDP
jgi:hypothetical protein